MSYLQLSNIHQLSWFSSRSCSSVRLPEADELSSILISGVHSLFAVPPDQLGVGLASHGYFHIEGRRILGDLRNRHGVDGLARNLREVKTVEDARNGDPHVHLAHLPSHTDSASCSVHICQ